VIAVVGTLHAVAGTAALVAGLCFLRFWRDTRDRLFVFFAVAFWLLALCWMLLALLSPTEEMRPYIYAIRLAAFGLIIAAIVDKNREARS
jgi:hypothetical protein